LREKGLGVQLATAAEEAVLQWEEHIPELIVIDTLLDLDGIQATRRLRAETVVPILLLTPRNNEAHILEAYLAGADECAVKPISPALFWAKVRAWLRRAWTVSADSLDCLQAGALRLEPTQRQVIRGEGEVIKLTNLEFRLLHLLMSHSGWVLKTDDIVQRVWGFYGNGDSSLLKNVVYRLRRKIDPDPQNPRYIHTEAGLGYRFQPD
jgi:DNA-binding response OmpR family regulator